MHTLIPRVGSPALTGGGVADSASLSSTDLMHFSKTLLALAGSTLLACPVFAAPSEVRMPRAEFGGSLPGANWDPSSINRIQVLRAEVASTASWYGVPDGFHGRRAANGEIFDAYGLTAAHRSLPFGTRVRVTNLNNNRSVVVRIIDRGPFVGGRVIDLSQGAASRIGMIATGTAPVRIEVVR